MIMTDKSTGQERVKILLLEESIFLPQNAFCLCFICRQFSVLLGNSGFTWLFSFAPVIQFSKVAQSNVSVESNFGFIIGHISDLFVSYVDALMSYKTFMRTKCF